MTADFELTGIFPCPVYTSTRDLDLDSTEEKEIEDIIKDGLRKDGALDHHTENTYIFDTSLKNLKEFCEHHIKNYVKEILNPEEELDFYITQSWLNVVEPAGSIHDHTHSNSIISGVFYISTEENDNVVFGDPNTLVRESIFFKPKKLSKWNSTRMSFPVNNNLLILFPSWLHHTVIPNQKAIANRISLAFNTFAKGFFGTRTELGPELNNLILK